jgi:hypothetical protein
MIAMTFTIERDIGRSFPLQSALPLASGRPRDNIHRRWGSKRSYGRCRRRTEIPEAEPSTRLVDRFVIPQQGVVLTDI